MTSAQLELINTDRDWKLDRRTVEVGRAGLAQARAALAAATAVKEEYLSNENLEDEQADLERSNGQRSQRITAVESCSYSAPGYVAQTLPVTAHTDHPAAA